MIKLRNTTNFKATSGATKRSTSYGGGSNKWSHKKKRPFQAKPGNKDKQSDTAGERSDKPGKSYAGGKSNYNNRDNRDKDNKKGADLKGENSTFLTLWVSNWFSEEALSRVHATGLDTAMAVTAAGFIQPGRISKCYKAWKIVTKDKKVLSIVADGYRLQFEGRPPPTPYHGVNPPSNDEAKAILDIEAEAVLVKGAARVVEPSADEVTSGYFARPKKTPGKWRPIVSLKYVNRYLRKITFRMTTVEEVRHWIRPGFWFTSVDLTDAYYSVPLNKSAWRFVRFVWRGRTYEYMTLVFGLASSPRVFTKVLTVVVLFLRTEFGICIVGYIDDFFIQAADPETCRLHTEIAILVLHICGFEVNFSKSALIPCQRAEYIGFIFDSQYMSVSLPEEKLVKLVSRCSAILSRNGCSADELRSLVGTLESVRPAVATAALHYRFLQYLLRPLLRGPWLGSKLVLLSPGARQDLLWWKKLTLSACQSPMDRGSYTVDIATDASGNFGWGGHSSRGSFAQGIWSVLDLDWHINVKELVSAHRSLRKLMLIGDYVNLAVDSRTTAAFINRQGGTRSKILCNQSIKLWNFVLGMGGWIRAHWVPREQNEVADMLSKSSIMAWEFVLDMEVAQRLWLMWYTPVLDLFASADCHLLTAYCSFLPDRNAMTRDCFSLSLWPARCYAFPPVPMISLTLDKLVRDRVSSAILVVPRWPASLWWMKLLPMLLGNPVPLPECRTILTSPVGSKIPFLNPLVACLVSGRLPC